MKVKGTISDRKGPNDLESNGITKYFAKAAISWQWNRYLSKRKSATNMFCNTFLSLDHIDEQPKTMAQVDWYIEGAWRKDTHELETNINCYGLKFRIA